MRIKEIHLKKYKRFFDITINLTDDPKRIVALIGPNGCGKSSVFDAMLFLNNMYNPIGNMQCQDFAYHSLENLNNITDKNVEINFSDGAFSEVREKKKNEGLEKTIFSFRSSFRYNSSLNVKISQALSELKHNDYGATSACDIDQRIEQNYQRLNIKYNNYMNQNDIQPSVAKKHILEELNQSITNCLNLSIDSLGDIVAGHGTIFFKKPDTERIFDFNLLSSGEKEVVDLLLDLYIRKDEYIDSIYIIDEPELHLNTAIQRKLLIEINKMIPPQCQIWIATHSIGFMRAIQEELNDSSQIIEFNENNKWASQQYTLMPIVKSRSNWHNIFATALDDLTDLISPKRIVYCEGQAKPAENGREQGMDAIVFNTIFSEHYPDTLFISSGGNTELDQRSDIAISILSKVFSSVEILVLKDRDVASGGKASEGDREDYLKNNLNNHRVLKRFEIENYLYDKEVLSQFCLQSGSVFDEESYDTKINDITNQNVKEMNGIIKNCCGIKVSIHEDTFKKNLAKVISSTMNVYKELEQIIFSRT